MDSYPWGPHGPQSGPNQVTPNPTPAYVPPPPEPAYIPPPSPSPSYGWQPSNPGESSGGAIPYAGPVRPRPKRYVIALILAVFFGPLGLFYATKKGALAMLFLLLAVPVALSMAGVLPYGSVSHPLAILEHSSVMDPMWSLCALLSMLWSVVAVNRHNAALKTGG